VFQASRKYIFELLLALACLSCLLWSQTETGQIAGTVTDPTGAVVPNAEVRVVSTSTGAERTTVGSGAGDFAVTNLLPGEYDVRVQAAGFSTFEQRVVVTVGEKVGLDVKMQIGKTGTTVQVSEQAIRVNTETQTLETVVTPTQMVELPTLTRNPYALVAISGNVSDAGAGNRGAGFAINGQREDSTNILLDGAANNNEFNADVGQAVPLDSVQEFSILTNNFTAEYGRASGGIINVVTKSGTNEFHGTAYEFNRVSKLSSNSFLNNASGLPVSVFTRNQFGYSFGGPIKKDKLFFFSSTEWIRIRSTSENPGFIPTSQFLADTAPNTQAFFNAYGKLGSGVSTLQTYTAADLAAGGYGCGTNATCNAFVTANPNLPLFTRIAYTAPGDAGGGAPENEYQTVARVDYNATDRTQMYVRYALQNQAYLPGALYLSTGAGSVSPYAGYDTVVTSFNNNALFSVVHTFGPTFVSQSKAVFNRLNTQQPLGAYPPVPTLYTGTEGALSLFSFPIYFPGYDPLTPGSGIPFGGPQNFAQLYEDLSWTHGKHEFRFGGSFEYLRDNRTFGAYETAGEYLGPSTGSLGGTIGNMLSGNLYEFQAAIYPQGKFPGDTVNLPLTPPNFSRSNRYREGAAYFQDSWKLDPRFTINLGLRWEYFGVQHNKDASLDANFYDPADQIDTPLGIREGIDEPASNHGGLWKPDYHDFAPRVGFAWDVTGNGTTSIRGGFGIGFERNFGNVTFNVIQNPPNYETVQILASNSPTGGPAPISVANFGILAGSSGTITLPRASLRNVDDNIQTAFADLWSTSIEHQVTRNFVIGADYTGSRGVHLYDISVLNRPGYGNVFLGDPCSFAAQDCLSTLNHQYSGINRRGDHGWSNYNGLTWRARLDNIGNSGLTMTMNYTWSHALDNLSSTFSDADSFSNNNGDFQVGYLDPYAPMLDKGSSDFDIRHRVSITGIWAIPAFKNGKGLGRQIFGGWELAPIFTARSGSPYSIFDCTNAVTFCPRAGFTTGVPVNSNVSTPVAGAPDTFNFLGIPDSSIDHYVNPIYLYSDLPPFPSDITGRNTFRAPGFWELDLGLYKTFALSERMRLQIRGEAYNLMNHANLYVNGPLADDSVVANPADGGTFDITSCRGCTGLTQDRRNIQIAAKLIF
jgi:hypothetical protein